MVQNTGSFEILGDGLEAVCSPLPLLSGECIDDLFDEYSKLVEAVRIFSLQG